MEFDPNQLFTFIENVPITPIQLVGTALSGRPVIRYTTAGVPSGLSLSLNGLMTGTVNTSVATNEFYDFYGTTGYSPDINFNYVIQTIPDNIVLFTNQTSYTVPFGSNVSIPIRAVTYSGTQVKNFSISGLLPGYGLSIDSSGVLSGTISGSIPPSTPFTVTAYAGNHPATLSGTLTSANPYVSSTITFTSPFTGGPTITSPSQTSFIYYQYMTISPIRFTGIGSGTVYFLLNKSDLPLGLTWDITTQTIRGSPMRLGTTTTVIYAKDSAGVRPIVLTFNVLIPRIIRQQDGAGAFTSLLRQYTEVSAAQNARDSRVYPSQERALGEFMAPEAPDVTTDATCKNLC
jgi:hypothetical protein